jgi:hypothetical protein
VLLCFYFARRNLEAYILLIMKLVSVGFWTLFAIYGILPLALGIALVDTLFFSGSLSRWLPRSPYEIIWYGLIFDLPHILASFFSLADKEYLVRYKQRLAWLPLVLAGFLLLLLVYPPVAIVAFITYTMYHLVAQQAGIGYIFGGRPHPLHRLWIYTSTAFLALGYLYLYFPEVLPKQILLSSILGIITSLVIVFCGLSFVIVRSIKNSRGRMFFLGTAATLVGSHVLILLGYPLLAVAMLRVMHDVTAFIIYAAHDHNRTQLSSSNVLYGSLKKIGPVLVLVPVVAIVLAFPLTLTAYTAGTVFAVLIAVTHYYTEGFVWKNGTPHRATIRFSI